MVKWNVLAKPVKHGGWGIIDIYAFSKALRLKSMWRGLFCNSLWSQVLHFKYIKPDFISWMRKPKVISGMMSPIWRGFLKVYDWIANDICWRVGNGCSCLIGVDPVLGLEENYRLSDNLITSLNNRGLVSLNDIYDNHLSCISGNGWLESLPWMNRDQVIEWRSYIQAIKAAGILVSGSNDKLFWSSNTKEGSVTARSAYKRIIQAQCIYPCQWWFSLIWKLAIPLKIKCFLWHVLNGSLKLWDNLIKRGWTGPGWCCLCRLGPESAEHLLMNCSFFQSVWKLCCNEQNLQVVWDDKDFGEGLHNWIRGKKKPLFLPIFISWIIWFERNEVIFHDKKADPLHCASTVCMMLQNFPEEEAGNHIVRDSSFSFVVSQPILFFDGAARDGLCAVGGVIYLNENHLFSLRLNDGRGSNMKAEVMALWMGLKTANIFGLVNLRVFGDSRVTIKWALQEFRITVIDLNYWCQRARQEISRMSQISFEHIYREHNKQADMLSKEAFAGPVGILIWEEWLDDCLIDKGQLDFF